MEEYVKINQQGLVEISNPPDAPDQTLSVHQSLELLRQRVRHLQLMTEYSPANVALKFAVNYFSTPLLQASHLEIVAQLLEGKQIEHGAMESIRLFVERSLKRPLETRQEEQLSVREEQPESQEERLSATQSEAQLEDGLDLSEGRQTASESTEHLDEQTEELTQVTASSS